ncbi:hypothetical protein BC828DRAFT_159126 [Blastocladiella britannica]|nr:hypothetical protein BC828DRAFT_159126 [Blastocladiella britannica]
MSAPQVFAIQLNQTSFRAGEPVSGTVILQTSSCMNVRALRICCKGTVRTRFVVTETVTDNGQQPGMHPGQPIHAVTDNGQPPPGIPAGQPGQPQTHQVQRTVTGKHKIMEEELTLWGTASKGPLVSGQELMPGVYSFPFSFAIPQSAPSSYESEHGRIRYKMHANLDRPWAADYVTTARVQVRSAPDPVAINGFMSQRIAEATKQVCCWFFSGGSVHVHAEVNHSVLEPPPLALSVFGGVVAAPPPGLVTQASPDGSTPLAVMIHLDNWSSRELSKITVLISRTETLRAEGHAETKTKAIAERQWNGPVAPKVTGQRSELVLVGSVSEAAALLSVPTLTAGTNNLIHVEYAVQVNVQISWACPLSLRIPVYVLPAAAPPMPTQIMYHCDVSRWSQPTQYADGKSSALMMAGQQQPPGYVQMMPVQITGVMPGYAQPMPQQAPGGYGQMPMPQGYGQPQAPQGYAQPQLLPGYAQPQMQPAPGYRDVPACDSEASNDSCESDANNAPCVSDVPTPVIL